MHIATMVCGDMRSVLDLKTECACVGKIEGRVNYSCVVCM